MTLETIIIIVAILALAALVQGYGGFGFGIVSISLLALLGKGMEQLAIIVSLVALVVVACLLALSRSRGHVRWKTGLLILIGIAIGQPAGYWFIATFGDQPIFRILLGIFLLAVGLFTAKGPQRMRRLSPALATPAGIFSGFLAGAFVTGGPPVVLYLYSMTEDPREMKGTIQFVFLSSILVRLSIIPFGAGYQMPTLRTAALAIPFAVVALVLGHWLSHKGSVSMFRLIVGLAISTCGIIAIIKGALLH